MVGVRKPKMFIIWPFTEKVCQPCPEQIKGWTLLAHPSVEGKGMKGRGARKPLWCFIKDVAFPDSLCHSHHHCPVCLETKLVPRPQQRSGGRLFEQPCMPPLLPTLGPQGWGCLRGSGFSQAHLYLLAPGGALWFGRSLSSCISFFYWGIGRGEIRDVYLFLFADNLTGF